MPLYLLGSAITFPSPREADETGLLAVGGDLRPERLLLAYASGIFPWYEEGEPILWYSPAPRAVLVPSRIRVGKSLARALRTHPFTLTMDTAFGEVIHACASVRRQGQRGTWITRDMQTAYVRLHDLGFAHSVDVWEDGELVGGLYGVSLGGVFCGESMFARRPNASKVALVALARQLERWSMDFIDCQLETEHLHRFGTEEWSRDRFLGALSRSVAKPHRRGAWRLEAEAWAATARRHESDAR